MGSNSSFGMEQFYDIEGVPLSLCASVTSCDDGD